ncbi:hypothetical protein Tco_0752501, partial [Tanacetum coccineum]
VLQVGTMLQAKKGSIIVGQHYGLSDLSGFQNMQGGPTMFLTQANTSFFEGAQATPSYDQYNSSQCNELGKARNSSLHVCAKSLYAFAAYYGLPKKRGDKSRNKGRNAHVAPFNLGNAVDDTPDAYRKLCHANPQRWLRAHCSLIHYNYMTSNSVESVNACIVLKRKLPITMLVETYRAMVQDWYFKRQELVVHTMTFKLLLHNYGRFTTPPGRKFVGGIVATIDPVEPPATIVKYEAYNINGYTFRTKNYDGIVYQNSGVSVEVVDLHISKEVATTRKAFYYGILQEICVLDYRFRQIPLFKCDWVNHKGGGVKHDPNLRYTLVDLNSLGHKDDPFILASQA